MSDSMTSGSAASHTHACCANHSCGVWQSGQNVRLKNTGVARKLSRSATSPVGMSRPVSGHLIITAPMTASPDFLGFLFAQIAVGCDEYLTRERRYRDSCA